MNGTKPGVIRIWKGRTRKEDFEAYSHYLHDFGVQKIRSIPGNIKVEMYRGLREDHADFMVISHWPDLDAIRAYAGEDIKRTRHLERDPEFLLELPAYVEMYEAY
jgi:heme-degrading monooxygenase HmoA